MFAQVAGILISYLLGSVSFSILLARWLKKIDIRQHGSGNAGATNTLRVLGKGPALAVFLLDIAKGVIAVLIGWQVGSGEDWVPVACGLAAIIGHNWPLYFNFKGGKGIATAIGVVASLMFWPGLAAGILGILSIVFTRYVSLGSLIFAVLLPVSVAIWGLEAPYIWGAVAICVLAVVRHRKNIANLIKGTENKLGGKKGEQHGT